MGNPSGGMTRRSSFKWAATAAAGAVAAASNTSVATAGPGKADDRRRSSKRYQDEKVHQPMGFPLSERMNLRECMQLAKDAGFDGIELNYDLDNDLSPKSGTKKYHAIRKMADEIGIAISGLCSFLFWPYPLTSNDPQERKRGMELAGLMTRAAHDLGVENLWWCPAPYTCPGVRITIQRPTAFDKRAREAMGKLLPTAEKLKVKLNVENIFFNGYLLSPEEMNDFVDPFGSEYLNVHFDTGNIMLFEFPEHWIPQLGKRIQNVHLKEFSKKGTDHSLECFRPLLDGTTNWPAVIEAFDKSGYDGYLTFEYFHPYPHYPEALIYQTADSLNRMLGIRS